MSAMDADDAAPSGITARIAGLFELLTTLDKRLLNALEVFEQMQGTLSGVDELTGSTETLTADVRDRVARFDSKLGREIETLRERVDQMADDVQRRTERLDERLHTALDQVDGLIERGGRVMNDVEARIDNLDKRVHRDLDDFKEVIDRKLEDWDLLTFVARFDRLEKAILNIEDATSNLDRAVEGTVGSLPEFVQKRVREEGRKIAPAGARDVPPA